MPDREKVVKDFEAYETYALNLPSITMISKHYLDTLALLKENETVVRCKDCTKWDKSTMKHYEDVFSGSGDTAECRMFCDMDSWGEFTDDMRRTDGNWFCADGERRTDA